jgi:TPP-dependent trihydroxycyclohexane-1,2-dione (THcHDO) dehydratase
MRWQGHPDRADDRRGDGDRERGAGAVSFLGEETHTEAALKPAAEALNAALAALDAAKTALLVVAGGALLLVLGAKVERYLMKRQLSVVDGAEKGGSIDLTEMAGGGRS